MKSKQLVPALILVGFLGALVWLVFARFQDSVIEMEWSQLVVEAPAVLEDVGEVLTVAEVVLATPPAEEDSALVEKHRILGELVEETTETAGNFAEILAYSKKAPVVEQGPLADKLDPFTSVGDSEENLVATVPKDYRELLESYGETRDRLDELTGETERLTADLESI